MPRSSLLNSPLLLGFDHFEQVLDRISKASSDGYPPYNIEQVDANNLRITLAVAGFSMDDLAVEVEGNQLIVRGKQTEDESKVFLHRGIAARQFQRNFVLAEGIEITEAYLDNGLLHIELQRPEVDNRVRTVKIRNSNESRTGKRRSAGTIDVTADRTASEACGIAEDRKMENANTDKLANDADLAALAVDNVAYIKCVSVQDNIAYAIHAADGTELAVVPNRDVAFAAVRQHGLEPVSVH